MTKQTRWAGVVVVLVAGACALKPPPREAPPVTASQVENVTESDASFAFRLYGVLAAREGNLFFSPAVLRMGLTLVWAGAKGETADELAKALELTGDPLALHKTNQALLGVWTQPGVSSKQERFSLRIANGVFVQLERQLAPDYSVLLTQRYGAPSAPTDFFGAPETARASINHWAEKQTDGKLEEVLPPGSIETGMQLVLVSAVSFKGAWLAAFDPEKTKRGVFQLPTIQPEKTKPKPKPKPKHKGPEVELMSRTGSYAHGESPEAQIVELPYAGDGYVMDVIVPRGELAGFEQSFGPEKLEQLLAKLQTEVVDVTLPRFEASTRLDLKAALGKLGVAAAFDPDRADFSGMDGTRKISLAAVTHQARLVVDEAAGDASPPAEPASDAGAPKAAPPAFRADRPFLYVIRDTKRNAILGLGRVLDPSHS